MTVMSLILVLLAPLPYWALGAPWCLGDGGRRVAMAPLVGCALAGLYAELTMIVGVSPRLGAALLSVASAGFVLARGRHLAGQLAEAVRTWLPLYFFSVLVSSISPFPVLGHWSGDWYLLYQMGEEIVRGNLPPTMLARPPLFGAAATPLWILGQGLIPYQLMSAVASASAVTVTASFTKFFWPRSSRLMWLPLLLSPFFLHHTAAAWAKLLAAGLILAAIIEARREQVWASAALFALSVATHEGSIIWAPCILAAHAAGGRGWRGAARALPALAVTGVVVAGPLLVWIAVKYGLGAKVAANPSVTDRDQAPFIVKTAGGVVTTFIGWEPVLSLKRWLSNPQRFSAGVVAKESFWLVTSWFTTLAGTLLGLLFPFLICWRRLKGDPLLRGLLRPTILAAVAFALIANGALCGFYSTEGTMQAAMVALALGGYGLLAGQLASAGPAADVWFRRMSWLTAIVGTVPWVLTNIGTATGLWLSGAFRARMQTASEGDYFRVVDNHLSPLGMAAFPAVPVFAGLLLLATLWIERRESPFARKPQVDQG